MQNKMVTLQLSLEDVDTILNALDLKAKSITAFKDYIYDDVMSQIKDISEEEENVFIDNDKKKKKKGKEKK